MLFSPKMEILSSEGSPILNGKSEYESEASHKNEGVKPLENGVKENSSVEKSHPVIVVKPAYEVQLDRILGLTVASNAALDCDPNTGVIAYPAGCTVVLLNAKRNRQNHIQNRCRKTVTSLAFSSCGRYLATGECGHVPSVRIWDLTDSSQVAEFAGHKFGVSCVAFSPTQKYVVSVGSQHDMIVNVWDWKAGVKVASNKFSSKVKAVSFSENGSYFVTVGNRHVKFWYLDVARGHKFKEPVPLTGRSAILGEQRNNYFCDVACGRGEMGDSTFAITKSGLLCEFNNRRLLDKWVELRTTCANCVVAGEEYIFVGCAEGIIRCFSPFNLQFITTLPRTHCLGVDVAQGLNISHMSSNTTLAKYPDTVAICLDENNRKVSAVYNDHSLYAWDITDIKRVGKSHSYLYHSACIWGIETYPGNNPSSPSTNKKPLLPHNSFFTCSSDDTIRIWNLESNMELNTQYKRNIYSQDLLKILYVDRDMSCIKDTDASPQGSSDKNDGSYDSKNGVRCIKLSSDGKHLASGDRAGNIRIHELNTNEEVCKIEAHDSEVLCLEFSKYDVSSRSSTSHKLLSSASRDRLIHVFDVKQDYNFVQTLDDHSSAITSVRFYQSQGNLQMVSCGADRSIIFRTASVNPRGEVYFTRDHNVAGKTTLYDMEVDHGQRHILTACQDRNIRVYNVSNGKHSKTFKGSLAEDGTLIKVVLDDSGIYAATSCTDKSICIYDYYSGECMASMYGHSEIVTGLKFTADGKYLITVSGDGCIFVWSIPRDMSQIMLARLAQQAERAQKEARKAAAVEYNQIQTNGHSDTNGRVLSPVDNAEFGKISPEDDHDYRFNVGQLPLWAKKQINEQERPKINGTDSQPTLDMPKGRWAQRLPNNPVTFKSHYDTDSMVPYPIDTSAKRIDQSESSKESSLENENNNKQFNKKIAPQVPPRKHIIKNGLNGHHTMSLSPDVGNEIRLGEDAFQLKNKKLTYPLTDESDVIHDSDVSSLRHDDGPTDPEYDLNHEGDVEDYDSESNHGIVYYPNQQINDSEFTVKAMDVDELRRSQRRHRNRPDRPERPTDIGLPINSVQELTDDDEASTPSGEAGERSMSSMLNVSCENVDRLGRRETFLKNNFDSLPQTDHIFESDSNNKNSISYKFNSRNKEVVNSNKRQELLRRIEETRNKLKSIGYKGTLRSSKSISDLCNIPEKESTYMTGFQDGGSGDSGFSSATAGCPAWIQGQGVPTGGMRRACSLSDLTNPGVPPKRILSMSTAVSGKKNSRNPKSRFQSMSRSSSIGMLNQSGDELSATTPTRDRPSAVSRHTISSINKMTPRALKRKSSLAQATSTGDIRQLPDDSSSEDTSASEHKHRNNRVLPCDRRSFPTRAISERDLSRNIGSSGRPVYSRYASETGVGHRKSHVSMSDMSRPSSACSTADFSPEEFGQRRHNYFGRLDMDSGPLNVSLVESVCDWVVEGCDRLTHLWYRNNTENNDEETHNTLRSLILGASARATTALVPLNSLNAFSTPPPRVLDRGPPVDRRPDTKDPRVVAMMEQYTDLLVNMVQQKMSQQKPPGAT